MTGPTVSVLMTVFNTEKYLCQAIDSVLSQTCRDLELIVIDDCSTDDGWSLIVDAASRDSRVRAIRRDHNCGAGGSLNNGLAVATGAFITRQDSDDISAPTRVAEQLAYLDSHPNVGAVGTQAQVIDSTGQRLEVTAFPTSTEEIGKTLLDYMCLVGPTVMVRRSVFERIGFAFDDESSGSEDYDLCLRVADVADIANLTTPLYLYRQHQSSVSQSQRSIQMRRKARALEKTAYRRFGPAPPPAAFVHAARDYVKAAVIGHATGEPVGKQDCIARALALNPEMFASTDLLESVVRRHTPPVAVDAAVEFTQSLFNEVLPPTLAVKRLKRRLVADLHLAEVFREPVTGMPTPADNHLWSAIRSNPAWLANRGVLSLVGKSVLAKAGLVNQTRSGS